jgi:hypothetical protein
MIFTPMSMEHGNAMDGVAVYATEHSKLKKQLATI